METYNLKDKILITKDFLNELEAKGWQEIEYLQAQIANIAEDNKEVIQLLKNLLTSYYVFTGELENLNDENKFIVSTADKVYTKDKDIIAVNNTRKEVIPIDAEFDEPDNFFIEPAKPVHADNETFEPFEYFVDFDEPIGEPLSDEDLYNN